MKNLKEQKYDYFDGKKLYGDDFSFSEIQKWFNDEKEASELLRDDRALNGFPEKNKDQKNIFYGLRFLEGNKIGNVLSLGGAYGEDLRPIISNIYGEIYIIEPSDELIKKQSAQSTFKYKLANVDGKIGLPDSYFDVVTSFKTLHHIPNVSFVVGEIFRVTRPGGIVLVSEPITSMGDWSKVRKGLTPRERGIPLNVFNDIILKSGFKIVKKNICTFSPLHIIFSRLLKMRPYNIKFFIYIDYILSNLFKWNYRYHRKNFFDKISPSEVFYVLKKPL